MSEATQETTETPQETPPAPDVPTPEPTPAEPAEDDEESEEEQEEATPEPVEPSEPEQPSGLTPKEVEAIHKRLDKEAERHAAKVGDILAEQAQGLVQCPLCLPNIPGFIYPVTPPAEVVGKVKEVLGEPIEPDYEKANNARTCDGCKGLGKRLSGSLVPDQRVLLCPDCNGRGWIGVGKPQNGTNAQNVTVEFTPEPQVAPEEKPATDPWGRTPDDVDYGRLPNYVRT